MPYTLLLELQDNIVTLISQNDNLKGKLNVRLQKDKDHIFDNILTDEDYFDLTICNPPFHSSAKEAAEHSDRKLKNLSTEKLQSTPKNFSGQNNELWCEGGEKAFIKRMIEQSLNFKNNCYWFTSLVSKKTNLNEIYQLLETADPFEIQTINMGQGNKKSRVVAWTYLNESQQETWKKQRWKDSKYS